MVKKIKSFLFKNTSTRQTVAKNTVWLTISNMGGRLLKAVVIIYGARVLGTAGWGVFSYAVTLAGFFTFLIDPGVNSIVMRDVPKADENEKLNILSTTFAMKLFFIVVASIIILTIGASFSTLPGARALLPIIVLVVAFDTIREFLSSFIRAMEQMEWEAGIFIFTNLAIVVLGFIFLIYSPTAKALGWAYAIGTATGALTALFVLRKHVVRLTSHFSPKLIVPILKSAWPFAVTGALGLLLTNTDILIISWMRTASEVGIYSAVIRIIQFLYVIPIILVFSTLPLLSRLAKKENEKFRMVLEKTLGIVFIASIPMALGGAILGTQIMTFIFGTAYATGGLAFKILILTLLIDYPTSIVSACVFAYNHQKSLIITSLIGAILNVLLDLLLIPSFGIVGSAIATLIAQFISNWYLWRMMKKINYFEILPRIRKVILSGIIMAVVATILLVAGINIVVTIIACCLCYFACLYVLREPLLIEMKGIMHPAIVLPKEEAA